MSRICVTTDLLHRGKHQCFSSSGLPLDAASSETAGVGVVASSVSAVGSNLFVARRYFGGDISTLSRPRLSVEANVGAGVIVSGRKSRPGSCKTISSADRSASVNATGSAESSARSAQQNNGRRVRQLRRNLRQSSRQTVQLRRLRPIRRVRPKPHLPRLVLQSSPASSASGARVRSRIAITAWAALRMSSASSKTQVEELNQIVNRSLGQARRCR